MKAPDLVRLFIEPIEEAGVSYMVTGGVASTVYGDPRFTRDIDIVLELRPPEIQALLSAFSVRDFYLPPVEALKTEVNRPSGGHFNIIHRESALRADVYLVGDDPLHRWALGRRKSVELEGMSLRMAPIEYVILRKLQYYRQSGSERHRTDVQLMLRISGALVDEGALEEWAGELELGDVLRDVREALPDG